MVIGFSGVGFTETVEGESAVGIDVHVWRDRCEDTPCIEEDIGN